MHGQYSVLCIHLKIHIGTRTGEVLPVMVASLVLDRSHKMECLSFNSTLFRMMMFLWCEFSAL